MKHKYIVVASLVAVTGVGIGAILWMASQNPNRIAENESPAKGELVFISQALLEYRDDCGEFPAVGDVADALTGGNALNKPYLKGIRSNDDGRIIDAWKTPIHISWRTNKFVLRSAGPNRQFGDKDDIEVVRLFDGGGTE